MTADTTARVGRSSGAVRYCMDTVTRLRHSPSAVSAFVALDTADAIEELVVQRNAMREALEALDAYWREDWPEGPTEESKPTGGIGTLMDGRLHSSTIRIWRQIRAALALCGERQ